MNLNFSDVLEHLGPDAAFLVANTARPPAAYMFNTLLPEVNRWDYNVSSGSLVIRTTMAGLVAMDSPYPPGGVIETSRFLSETAKIANQVTLTEATLRQLQLMVMQLLASGQSTTEALVNESLNFMNKVIVQAHLDTLEWMRGQALVTGAINWTFNKQSLVVDYGVPAANFLANRTGNDAYGGSASKFWEDVRAIRRLLKWNVRAFIAHPETIDVIVFNAANGLEIVSQNGMSFTVRKLLGANERPSTDARDVVELIGYDLEAEVFDLTNEGRTKAAPFMPKGKILGIGNNGLSGYRVGEGLGSATEDPLAGLALGYTHIAPTVEGGGRPGRWGDMFVPQNEPMKLTGRAVTNALPVIEAPEKIAVASTDMPA